MSNNRYHGAAFDPPAQFEINVYNKYTQDLREGNNYVESSVPVHLGILSEPIPNNVSISTQNHNLLHPDLSSPPLSVDYIDIPPPSPDIPHLLPDVPPPVPDIPPPIPDMPPPLELLYESEAEKKYNELQKVNRAIKNSGYDWKDIKPERFQTFLEQSSFFPGIQTRTQSQPTLVKKVPPPVPAKCTNLKISQSKQKPYPNPRPASLVISSGHQIGFGDGNLTQYGIKKKVKYLFKLYYNFWSNSVTIKLWKNGVPLIYAKEKLIQPIVILTTMFCF